MKLEFLQDEPKLTLMFPYKDTFNRVGGPSIISLSVMFLWILKYLMAYNTDFSDKIVMAIVLIYAPLLIWFLGYSLFINGVKLEVYKNNIVQYYTYSNRGHSLLHYQFKLQDIEQLLKDSSYAKYHKRLQIIYFRSKGKSYKEITAMTSKIIVKGLIMDS